MNLQKTYNPKVLQPPTKTEKEEAHEVHSKILNLITEVKAAESDLEGGYVKLGQLVYKVQVKTMWIPLGYNSWREYMEFLSEKYGTGRTQLYGYIGTVKTLSPYVDDQTLTDMGISKAKELKRAVDTTSKAPSEELLEKARDPKVLVPEFRKAIQEEFHIIDHNEKGIWIDLGGIYLTQDEKDEWEKAIDLAKSIDPVVSAALPKHVQFKEALMRLVQEFIASHPDEPEEDPWLYNENFSKKPDVDAASQIFSNHKEGIYIDTDGEF